MRHSTHSDLDAIMTYFADDCLLELPRGPEPWGTGTKARRTCASDWQRAFEGYLMCTTATSSISLTKTQPGMSKWLLTGTTTKGTKVRVQGCGFYTFRDDGKIIRKDLCTGRSSNSAE